MSSASKACARGVATRRGLLPFGCASDETTIIDLLQATEPDKTSITSVSSIEPTDLDALAASGASRSSAGLIGAGEHAGDGTSLYVLEPDGNVVELATTREDASGGSKSSEWTGTV